MGIRRFSISRIAVFLLILTVATFAFAADKVGKPGGGGLSIEWQLSVSGHERVVLTVLAPDGQDYRSSFGPGKNPSFSVRDLASIEDGEYNYELRVEPKVSGKVKSDLEKARKAGDDAAARAIMKAAGLSEVVQSGSFQVANGSIVSPNEDAVEAARVSNVTTNAATPPENIASRRRPDLGVGVNDQVIPDDLIVQGSACVGLDCVNNESFGFDTIRLKENNTRIKFEDTSVGSFPTNDWQLTANDSASGASSKFSVEDITGSKVPFTLQAGAATNSIFVDSTGRVGFRTSTPVLDLHISTSNTPALRLEQTNSGGFTAQTWDVAGNEANFFVRDVTGGSKLSFRIRPGAPTSSLDIASDGDVGIGTASPETDLHVFASSTADAAIGLGEDPDGSTGTQSAFNFGYAGASLGRGVGFINVRPDSNAVPPNPSFRILTSNVERMIVTNAGNVGIGVSGPSSKLHVNGGDIRVSSGSFIDDGTTLNVPDYVFDPGYSLMSLNDLDSFVKTNRHLPGIPNAANVKERGLNLSEMQMKLLEKVEELTLYVLEQKKEVEQLRAANSALETRLAEVAKSN